MQEMTAGWFTAEDGAKLFVRKWIPESRAVAALQIVHGMCEHTLRYERIAARLADAGVEVWAADMRGHGRTADLAVNGPEQGGLLGHCADENGIEKMLADIHGINTALHEQHPDVPLFLMGHSWWSFLTQAYIERFETPRLAGCILSGTRGPDGRARIVLGGVMIALLLLFRSVRGKSRLAVAMADGAYRRAFPPSKSPHDWLSRDIAEVEAFAADPLCGQTPSLGFYRDLARLLLTIHQKKNMARIPHNLPLYLFSGSRDAVGDMGKSPKTLVKWYQKLGVGDIAFVLYPEGRHEMLHEINHEEVEENLLSWIL